MNRIDRAGSTCIRSVLVLAGVAAVVLALVWLPQRPDLAHGPAGVRPILPAPRSSSPAPSPVVLAEPGPVEGRTELPADSPEAGAEARVVPPPDPLEVKYGRLDLEGLRLAIEQVSGRELRARLEAAVREAHAGEAGLPESGEQGPRLEMAGPGETFRVRKPGSRYSDDVTWFVDRDPSVQRLRAEARWLQAQLARLEASERATR